MLREYRVIFNSLLERSALEKEFQWTALGAGRELSGGSSSGRRVVFYRLSSNKSNRCRRRVIS